MEPNNKRTVRFSSFDQHFSCAEHSTVAPSTAASATTASSSRNLSSKSILTYVGIFTLGGVLTAATLTIVPLPPDPTLFSFEGVLACVAPGLALHSDGVVGTVIRRSTSQTSWFLLPTDIAVVFLQIHSRSRCTLFPYQNSAWRTAHPQSHGYGGALAAGMVPNLPFPS